MFNRKQWERLWELAKKEPTICALISAYERGNIDFSTLFLMIAESLASLRKDYVKALMHQPPARYVVVTHQQMDKLIQEADTKQSATRDTKGGDHAD